MACGNDLDGVSDWWDGTDGREARIAAVTGLSEFAASMSMCLQKWFE